MKKLLNFIVCSTAIFALFSCNVFNDNEQSQDTNNDTITVEVISQEMKDKIAAQDTLMGALVLEVDTLGQALTQVHKENAELKARVAKLENPKSTWGYMTFAALAIAIIAFILSLLTLLRKGVSREKGDKSVNNNFDKSQRKVIKNEESVGSLKKTSKEKDARSQKVKSTDSSGKANEVHDVSSAVTKPQEQPCQSPKAGYLKKGYAKINNDEFFAQIFDSAEEDCVFSIEFKSATKGEFNIIAVDKVKSRNNWQEIVECTGLSIKDATSFKVKEFGICEKCDDSAWKITRKLKIELS